MFPSLLFHTSIFFVSAEIRKVKEDAFFLCEFHLMCGRTLALYWGETFVLFFP